MSKYEKAKGFTIGEVSKTTGVEIHTLRYWGQQFSEFLSPNRTDGGQRRYDPQDIQTILVIKGLVQEQMYSIPGAKKHMSAVMPLFRGIPAAGTGQGDIPPPAAPTPHA